MKKICKKEHLKVEFTDPRPGDIRNSFADINKASNMMKFEPKFDIELGLKDYIEWSKNKNYAI